MKTMSFEILPIHVTLKRELEFEKTSFRFVLLNIVIDEDNIILTGEAPLAIQPIYQ